MRTAALVIAGLLAAGLVQAQTVTRQVYGDRSGGGKGFLITAAMSALDIHSAGRNTTGTVLLQMNPDRVAVNSKLGPDDYAFNIVPVFQHQWPGVYYEAAFKGGTLYAKFDDDSNIYTLTVDNRDPIRIARPGKSEYRIDDLGDGPHTVRLETITESMAHPEDFLGFYVSGTADAGNNALPAPSPRARQIEIIGDSYAAGYGTTSTRHECTPDEIHDSTDTQQAFGALVGKHYDADYQVNAVSGIGMVRNYDDSPGDVMPALYPYALFDKSVIYDDPSWNPQVVVVALGDNDFATPVHAGEKWADDRTLRGDFIDTYLAFLKTLRARNPKAAFVLMDYGEPELIPDLQAIAAIAKTRGDTRILTWSAGTGFEQTGCDWHLSLNDHKRIAAGLEALIDAQTGIWNP